MAHVPAERANASASPSQSTLLPPNGKMVAETIDVSTPQTCSVSCNIVGVPGDDRLDHRSPRPD